MIRDEQHEAHGLFHHGMMKWQCIVEARKTTFIRLYRIEDTSELAATLLWADAEAMEFDIVPISKQYAEWLSNGCEMAAPPADSGVIVRRIEY
jgi:hypothetical protein